MNQQILIVRPFGGHSVCFQTAVRDDPVAVEAFADHFGGGESLLWIALTLRCDAPVRARLDKFAARIAAKQ